MPSPKECVALIKGWLGGTRMTGIPDDVTFSGNNTHSGTNTISGSLTASSSATFSGQVDHSGTRIDPATVSPTAALTLTSAHYGKTIKCGSLCRTVTLPLAATGLDGVRFTILNTRASTAAAGELDVQPTSEDSINGGTSGIGFRLQTTADAIGDSVTMVCDGSGWYTIAKIGTWAASTV